MNSLPETNWVEVKTGAPAGVIVTSPAPAPAVSSTTAMDAYNSIVADGGVGNSRGLNCDGSWYNRRDSIDVRVINEVKTGTGKIIDDPSQVGGWIIPAAGTPCVDNDHDGMPDTWEQLYGFNPNIPEGSADKDGDGYTNIEEYINGTNPGGPILIPSVTPTVISAATNTPTLMPTATLPMATITASPVPVSATATIAPTATPTKTATIIAPTPTFVPVTPATVPAGQNTVDVRVAKGVDDVEESSTGSMYVNSSDLELVYDGSNQVVGMRFRGVSVPKGATITNAYLQFKVDETSSNVTMISIQGEAKSNALAFSNTKRNVSARLRTINAVSWSPSSWLTLGAAGIGQRTPNLAPIVQEIVSQTSWVAGNSMVMIITGSGKRVAKAYEVDPAGAPLLHIEYTVAATSATNMLSLTATTVPTTNTPAATATVPAIAISPTPTLLPATPTTSVTDIPSSTMPAPWT